LDFLNCGHGKQSNNDGQWYGSTFRRFSYRSLPESRKETVEVLFLFLFLYFSYLACSLNLIMLASLFIVLIKLTLLAATLDYRLRPLKPDISSDIPSKDVGSPSSVEFLNSRGGIASVALLVLHHDLFPRIGSI
jgi:hypothetical protein